MKRITLSIICTTIFQFILCGFSMGFLMAFIGRLFYLGKLLGMGIKLQFTIATEILSIFFLLIIPFLFNMRINAISVIVSLLCSAIISLIEWYDDTMYIYIEEDVK